MSFNTATPHIASYIIFRKGNKVALLLRQNCGWMDGHYGLPAGKVEKNEPFTLAASREAEEEVDVLVAPEDLRYLMTIHRKSPENDMEWVDVFFEAERWQGKLKNAEPHMHASLDWFEMDELPENIIPMVRFALEQIKAGKSYAEYGWN